MGFWEALILGIIQGLTEFLPVSSSGHLELGKVLLGVDLGEDNMLFSVVLHAGTAISTIVIFRNEVKEIFRGLFQFKWNEQAQFSVKIILSMVPAVFVGIRFNDEIKKLFEGNILLVGAMLIVTGLLLFLADRAKKTDKKVSYSNATIIGI